MDDLLAGYESSSDEDDDHRGGECPPNGATTTTRAYEIPRPAAAASATNVPASNPDNGGASQPPLPRGAPPPTTTTTAKGRKLLSFASVLPPQVWEQLVRAGSGEDESDDDGNTSETEEGVAEPGDDEPAQRRQGQNKGREPGSNHNNDDGLQQLLSDLSQFKAKQRAVASLSSTLADKPSIVASKDTRLGAAFVAATVTTTTTTSSSTGCRTLPLQEPLAPHVGDLQTHERRRLSKGGNNRSAVVAAPNVKEIETTNAAFYSSSDSHSGASLSQPRIAPAPTWNNAAHDFYSSGGDPTHSHSHLQSQSQSQWHYTEALGGGSKKRSRQELERALRQGRVGDVLDGDRPGDLVFQSLSQPSPAAYTPQPETYAVPAHGIRVAAAPMYDPKVGATVVGAARGRGKNQIHHLMASAAQLELQRARQPESQAGKVHRANARQKYGW